MPQVNLQRLGVALVTPFNKTGKIDFQSLGNILDHLVKGGCDYLVVLGTTAETPTLTFEERQEISRFINKKISGRLPLIIGIGGNNTAGVVNDVRNYDLEGYSAILSVAPYYNKPTQEGLYRHFMTIAENSPLPIILYNVPGRTGVNLTAHTTLRLSSACQNIIGIKEASGNLDQCRDIISGCGDDFALISGNDSDTVSIIRMGGKGVISVLGNALPKITKRLVNLSFENNFEEACQLQNSLKPLIGHLFEDGNPAGVKFALQQLGLCQNILRLPLTPVSSHISKQLEKELQEFL